MKLISMTDFVLNESKTKDKETAIVNIYNYALFLKQPLAIGMFAPCNEDGNVLEEPENPKKSPEHMRKYDNYVESKERVFFEGFSIVRGGEPSELTLFLVKDNESLADKHDWEEIWNFDYSTIENLSLIYSNINLTQSAIKQIGL